MERPRTALSLDAWGVNDSAERLSLRPESQPLTPQAVGTRLDCVEETTMQNASNAERKTRSENLRMKLKQHEHMIDALK